MSKTTIDQLAATPDSEGCDNTFWQLNQPQGDSPGSCRLEPDASAFRLISARNSCRTHSKSGLVSWPLLAWGVLIGTLVWTSGCDSAPRAPLLRDSPVYHSESEGFRFRVPEGWSQSANSVLPAGDLPGDIFLTRYQVKTTEGGASMQIICCNDKPVEQLEKHWSGPAFGVAEWKVVEPLQKVNAGSIAGERIVYSGLQGGKTLMKHVTCLHKNKRLYSFVGLYWQNDIFARQQVERALDSLIW